MIPYRSRWQALLVRSGKGRARAAIVGFSVLTSVVLVVAFMLVVRPPREEWVLYLLPAILVPLIVSPLASHLVLELAFALDAANRRVRQQEEQLAALFEHAPIGMALLDALGNVRSANPRMRALLGAAVDEASQRWSRVFLQADALTEFRSALRAGRPLDDARWQWSDPERRERLVRVALMPISVGSRSPNAADGPDSVLLAEDITEREVLDAQALRAQKLELVGQLAGGIAHDFNNLLTVVRGSVGTLGGAAASPELASIDDAAERGARLTRRLLAISRHDLITRAPHGAPAVIDEAVELMRRVLPSRIRMIVAGIVPDVEVDLDRDAVQQALLNLAVNARDAISGEGTITLEARQTMHDGRSMLVLAMVDDGHGMPEAVRARAIEPFFTTKAAESGTGLGLAMVHGTMRSHDGWLALESAPGAGTRAELWFPVVRQRTAIVTAGAAADRLPVAAAVRQLDDATVASVLLVEDEAGVRLATERALQRLGYVVTSVADMTAALAQFESGAVIDVVVSDVMMPGGTGVDLLREVRRAGYTTPFLLVSGYATDDLTEVRATDAHVGVLNKPWSGERLGAAVEALRSLQPQ
jgi:two-component system cell cycle sensor histidine kinase/response regulator CckA